MRARCAGPKGGRQGISASVTHGEGLLVNAEGQRARAERTWNMRPMLVTLDVSKLSGWLNAAAFCRVERRTHDAGRGAGREIRGRAGAAVAQARRARGGPE